MSEPTRAPVVLARSHHFAVAQKPAGVPTEPAPGHATCLREMVAAELSARANPHAVSRLDVNVSGCALFALTDRAKQAVAAASAGAYTKRYVAIIGSALEGAPPAFATPIDGRDARTELIACVASARGPAFVTLAPITGRTHQLRIHCSRAGAAILGDAKHGGPRTLTLENGRVVPVPRVMLHAYELLFAGSYVELGLPARVRAELPPDLRGVLDVLGIAGG